MPPYRLSNNSYRDRNTFADVISRNWYNNILSYGPTMQTRICNLNSLFVSCRWNHSVCTYDYQMVVLRIKRDEEVRELGLQFEALLWDELLRFL